MPVSAHVRLQVERALQSRVPGALSPRARVQFARVTTGIPEADALLGGGFPVGGLSELVGTSCSGRTSLALALTAEVTRSGGVSAWIDATDALDPESALAAGVDLAKLLWVRCGGSHKERESASEPSVCSGTSELLYGENRQAAAGGGGSPHPRGESRGMPEAVQAFLQHERGCTSDPENSADISSTYLRRTGGNAGEARRALRKLGTPGMPNRLLSRVVGREEQPPTDRMPSRRGKPLHHPTVTMVRGGEVSPTRVVTQRSPTSAVPQLLTALQDPIAAPMRKDTWQVLDQALRAADLLLNAGGFGTLVLDFGCIPPEMAWRIPLATWFRFRAAAERSRTAVLLLTQHSCARSSAELVLCLEPLQTQSDSTVLTGVHCEAAIFRQRFDSVETAVSSHVVPIRKPPGSVRRAQWVHPAAWGRSAP